MTDIRPILKSILKAPLPAAFFVLFGLSACNPSWVSDPLAKYLQNKTGVELKIEKISVGLHPLVLETRGVQLSYKKELDSWEAKIPDLRAVFDWTLTWEGLPWPEVHIEKIIINRPSLSIRIPHRKEGDWTVWLKKIPVLKEIEINDLQGRLELGKMVFRLSPGTQVRASFSPDQGGKVAYQIKSLEGRWPSKGIRFITQSQGSFELTDLTDRPKWKGQLTLFNGNFFHNTGKVTQVSGPFHWMVQDRLFEITASPARVQGIEWKSKNISLAGQGRISWSGTFRVQNSNLKGAVLSGMQVTLEEMEFDFLHGNQMIKGPVGGQVRLDGPLTAPVIQARIVTGKTAIDLPPVYTLGLETSFEVQGKFPVLTFPLVKARAVQSIWQLPRGPMIFLNPDTRFSVQIKIDRRQIHLKDIILKTENWNPMSGSLLFDLHKGPIPRGTARSENFPLLKFLNHFFPKIDRPFPNEIPCQGTIEWSRETADSPIDFRALIRPVPFSFQIPDTDWEGEDLKTQIQGNGKWFFKDRKVLLNLTPSLSEGSLSRLPWVFDFDQNPLQGRLEATVESGGGYGSVSGSLGLQFDPLGPILISGEWPFGTSLRSFSGQVLVEDLPLEKGFPLLVGNPLSEDHPFWEKVSLQGKLNARISLMIKESSYDLMGRMSGSGIGMEIEDPGFSFQKGRFDFPFHLVSSADHPGQGLFSETGFIEVENFQGLKMDLEQLRFPLQAGTNRFEITDNLEIPGWGGKVALNFLKFSDPLEDFKVDSAVSLKNLDLTQLFSGQGITGTLEGDLGLIRIDKEKAQIEGTLKAHIFEGTVEGKNWGIIEPFSPEREIRGDLIFSHLNLEPITQRFSFGKITGFVQGRVMDLMIRRNHPERFDLQIETQEVPGVHKIINIKAIENIGLLGTGWGDLDDLRKGINRFISEYAYQKIGLACILKDDLFRLRGTIIEEGVEYLVRKPSWFGIDVINKNPDNEILFSDILERIQSIGKKP